MVHSELVVAAVGLVNRSGERPEVLKIRSRRSLLISVSCTSSVGKCVGYVIEGPANFENIFLAKVVKLD